MKKKKIIIYEIFFGISCVILLLIYGNYLCAKQFQYKIKGKQYIQIINDGVSKEQDLLTNLNSLMKTYHMLSSTKYPYVEYSEQNLEYIGNYSMDEKFINGGKEFVNQKVNGYTISPLKAIGIGMKTFDYMGIGKKIKEGNGFSKSDFEYNNRKTMPLLLGNQYKDYLAIGDKISFFYLGQDKIDGEVIGFFDSNEKIDDMKYDLNYSIIFPLQNVKDIKNVNYAFVQRLYTIKTEGEFAYCNRKQYYNEISLIENIKKKSNIELQYVGNLQMVPSGEKYKMSVHVAMLLNVLGLVIMFSVCLALWYSILNSMKKDSIIKIGKKVIYIIVFNFILYEILYKITLKICKNNALELNIMRQKEFIMKLIGLDTVVALTVVLIIYVIRRRKINGSNRGN